jgi:hypothetical protein
MAATTTAPATGAQPQGQAPQAPSVPFRAGTFRQVQTDGYSQTVSLTTATQTLAPYSPSPNAFLRGIWLMVTGTTSGNSATPVVAADGPFNVISSLTLQDANQKPIVGPVTGHQLAMINKYGGYQNLGDPRASAVYNVTTGSGGTAGSFAFSLYVPLEIVSRDTLGALQNKSSSSQFQLVITVNTEAAVYGTSPTSAPSVNVTALEDGWVQPTATDATGNAIRSTPPQLGTTQYWTVGSYSSLNGSVQQQLTQGLGYPVRNFMAINYDVSAGTRATGDTDWPSPVQFLFKGTSMSILPKTFWKDQMSRTFDYFATTLDAINGLDAGVYVLPFTVDFSSAPGDELRNAYLATSQGDQFQLLGTFAANSNLYWLANYVAPAAGANNLASIRAGA